MLIKIMYFIAALATIALGLILGIGPLEGSFNIFEIILLCLACFVAVIIAFIILVVLFYAVTSLTFNKNKEYEELPKVRRIFFNLGVEFIINLLRVKINYQGLDKLPKDKKFFMVSNHRSMFDVITHCYYFRNQDFVEVSKPENFALPIAGPYIHGMCHLSIDRDNNRNALKTIIKAIKYIETDKFSVGLCPEGTRNKGEGLLPFKSGCFKIALKAKCTLVICTMKNTDKVFKNFLFRKTVIDMTIVDVLDYEEFKDLNTHELALLARRKMVENLELNETVEESSQMIE